MKFVLRDDCRSNSIKNWIQRGLHMVILEIVFLSRCSPSQIDQINQISSIDWSKNESTQFWVLIAQKCQQFVVINYWMNARAPISLFLSWQIFFPCLNLDCFAYFLCEKSVCYICCAWMGRRWKNHKMVRRRGWFNRVTMVFVSKAQGN